MNEAPARILLAEDEEIIATIIHDLLEPQGFQVTVCPDGLTAWSRLQEEQPGYDVILLDRIMPGLDGMELLRRIKGNASLSRTPVIVETVQGDKNSIREGLEQGAYYYLTKPFQPEVLLAVVHAALQQAREWREMVASVRKAERPFALLQSGAFRFRDLDEGRLLAHSLAHACPEPERAVLGLQELLINAVEHGNLEIDYREKSALLMEGTWSEEIERRLQTPHFGNRQVEVSFERKADSLHFTIRDEGIGFDWRGFLDFCPERAFDLHGRGIAMAGRLSFDHLEYRGNGNTVVATIHLPPAARPPGG
ncbi:MAG: response regulator [Magnetococcales bacterium]|nr:response regulator [Magnetococcales bacterium]